MSDAVPEVELHFLTYSVLLKQDEVLVTLRGCLLRKILGDTQTQSKFRAFDIMKEIIQQFTHHM